MTSNRRQPDSLGSEVTRGEDPARLDSSAEAGNTDASFGELETGADSRSSLSDLADLGTDADGPQEIVDLAARYEILVTLGRGGMGEVVRAVDRRLKREVAIKRMRAEFGASRQAMRRFLTEAVSVAALNHYNVVQIYDYGHSADGPFLVMELVEGPSLAERLQEGALPLEVAIDLVCQLCNGLQTAHDRGIIHRDIKPANILLTAEGVPKLTDFGLAKEVTETGNTRAGAVLGTLDYMAPEQKADASRADARSDQWSLAATFYQMVTGEVPRVIDLDEVPAGAKDVIRIALKSRPSARYDSLRQFSQALRDTIVQAKVRSFRQFEKQRDRQNNRPTTEQPQKAEPKAGPRHQKQEDGAGNSAELLPPFFTNKSTGRTRRPAGGSFPPIRRNSRHHRALMIINNAGEPGARRREIAELMGYTGDTMIGNICGYYQDLTINDRPVHRNNLLNRGYLEIDQSDPGKYWITDAGLECLRTLDS